MMQFRFFNIIFFCLFRLADRDVGCAGKLQHYCEGAQAII